MRIRQGNDFIFLWAIERNGEPEDFSNAVNIKLHFKNFDCVGEVKSFQIVDGNIVRVEVSPEWASNLGAYRLILSYEFEDESYSDGDRKCVVDVLAFNIVSKTSEADDVTEVSETTDIMIGLKGDKGDPFTYDDFTPEQIEDLKRPAIEAAESVQIVENQISINEQGRGQAENERETAETTRVSNENNRVTAEQARVDAENLRTTAESSRGLAESLRVEAELLRQSSTQEAISNAESATENANTAAQNADDARLAIQDDLALKADQADLVQLAVDSITRYKEGDTLVDGQIVYGDNYKIIQRSVDAWATRSVFNLGKSLIVQSEPVSTDPFLNQRFLQAIISINLKGRWKISDTDEYFIRRYYDSGISTAPLRNFTIELGAMLNGVSVYFAKSSFEYDSNGGLLQVPIVRANFEFVGVEGYMIVDQSMLGGFNITTSLNVDQSRIGHINDLSYNIDDFKHSIFTQSLTSRFSTEIKYNRFVNRFLRLKIYGKKSEKIYLSSINKIYTDGNLTGITVYFAVLRDGAKVDVLSADSYPVTNEITDIPLTAVNDSGLSGILTLDLREPYKLDNVNTVSAENLPYYEVINVFYEIEDSEPEPEPIPQLIENGYQVELKSGFKIRNTVENTDYTLHIDDTGIWSKSGRFGTVLRHQSSFDEPNTRIYTFPIYINRVEELEDGEFLIFLGHDSEGDTSELGVWRSFNNRTEFSQVIAPSNPDTTFPSWSTFIVRNQVIIGEYGSFTDNAETRGSRYLYYSSDNGKTFTPILDLMNAPDIFPTQDGWKQCHIHGACIDPYWDRIWICTGDGDNSKLLAWTDDLGITWDSINLYQYTGGGMTNQTLQFISLYPLKNTLVIAPDTAANYMYKVDRIKKSDTPVIQRTWAFNNTNAITHLTNGYVRFSPADPLYILMGAGDNVVPPDESDRHNFILATFDGTKYWKIWEDEKTTIYPDEGVNIFKYKEQYIIEVTNRDEDGLNPIRVRHFASSPEWL